MISNLLLSAPADNFRTVRLNNPVMLSIAIFLGLAFITAVIITIIKSGRNENEIFYSIGYT